MTVYKDAYFKKKQKTLTNLSQRFFVTNCNIKFCYRAQKEQIKVVTLRFAQNYVRKRQYY